MINLLKVSCEMISSMVRFKEEGPVWDFRDKLLKPRYSPSTRTSPPEPLPVKVQVVIACISFLLVFKIHFSTIHFKIYSYSCFASFVPCSPKYRPKWLPEKLGALINFVSPYLYILSLKNPNYFTNLNVNFSANMF